ncbi:hypothetical protein ACF1AE_21675 [Streptomyces sp. NPDC014986]|uniref:hypothetical protein n=1 Tax=Streptomyces sp. NPDC014986 TaxID=3364934 RepID=UPI0036FDCC85
MTEPQNNTNGQASPSFSAEQKFAALYQAIKPEHVGDRFDRGYAWAMESVRRILAGHRLDGTDAKNLATVEPAIRAWLYKGPDYDSAEYNRGCRAGQDAIRAILDGDDDEICSQLEDAARAYARLLPVPQED